MTVATWGLAACLVAIAPNEPLTIDQAVETALSNAFAIQTAESRVGQARGNESAAGGALRLQLNGSAQYVRLAEGVSFGTGGSGFGGSTSDSKQVGLVLSQLIDITGVTRKSVEASRFQRMAAEKDLEAQVNEIKSLVRTQFYQVLQAQALVVVQSDEHKSALKRLENARIREREGDLSLFDVKRLETDSKRSEQALVEAEGNLRLAKQALNLTLGLPIGTEFEPQDVPGLPAVEFGPDEATALALESRPEVQSAQFLVQAADSLADAEAGGLKPTLSFSAQYSRTIDPPPGSAAQSLFGVLSLSIPVFDSGITRARTKAAREVEEQAKIALEQRKLNVSLDVRNALTRMETTRAAYEVALSGLELATESLRLAELRFDEGAGILLDVTTSQAELTRARGAVVTARYQYLAAIASLQRAIGDDTLQADNL